MIEKELIREEKNGENSNNKESSHRSLMPEMLRRESIRLEISIFTFIIGKMLNGMLLIINTSAHLIVQLWKSLFRSMIN